MSELPGRGVTRRRFLQAVPLSAMALAACERRPYNAADFVLPARSNVALLNTMGANVWACAPATLMPSHIDEFGVRATTSVD